MDLLSVLPDFATNSYAHILPPLERSKITTVDLITLDTLEIAKRAHVPPTDVRRLSAQIIEALHADLGFEKSRPDIGASIDTGPSSSVSLDVNLGPAAKLDALSWNTISTLDPAIDALLGGGIPLGYVTEITGESGSGKTQFLLSLLLSAQLVERNGLPSQAVYISTEHPLATNRLSQMLECHPLLSNLSADKAPSLENILAINAMDLETQDHILNYQLPVALANYNVGLVIIDSVTSNYRAEHSSNSILSISTRSTELAKLGQMLRNLAAKENIAIVLANQVSDRFEPTDGLGLDPAQRSALSQSAVAREAGTASPLQRTRSDNTDQFSQYSQGPSSSQASPSSPYHAPDDEKFDGSYLIENPARSSILSLVHQERFFTGWGDAPHYEKNLKTPALGYFWTTQIACRIALKKEARPSMAVPWESGDISHTGLTPMEEKPAQGIAPPDGVHQQKKVNSTPSLPDAQAANSSEKSGLVVEGNHPLGFPKNEASSREPIKSPTIEQSTRRTMKLVFAPWTAGAQQSGRGELDGRPHATDKTTHEIEFELWKGGLRSICPDNLNV